MANKSKESRKKKGSHVTQHTSIQAFHKNVPPKSSTPSQQSKKVAECHLRDPTLPPIRIKRKSVLGKMVKRTMTTPAYREHHHFARSSTRFELPQQTLPCATKDVENQNPLVEHVVLTDENIIAAGNVTVDDEQEEKAAKTESNSSTLPHQCKIERMVGKRLNLMRAKATHHKNRSFENVIALPP